MGARQDDRRRIGEVRHSIEQLQRRLHDGPIAKPALVSPQNALGEMAADGIVYGLLRILEGVVTLSDGTRVLLPGYEWNEIRGMRDRLVHGYTGTDFDFVWDATEHEVPTLRQLCLDFCALHGPSVDDVAPDDQPRP